MHIISSYNHTIIEFKIQEVLLMPKAKQYVDQSMSTVQSTITSLQQALSSAEKEDNKNKIQSAINSLNSACQQLSSYQD